MVTFIASVNSGKSTRFAAMTSITSVIAVYQQVRDESNRGLPARKPGEYNKPKFMYQEAVTMIKKIALLFCCCLALGLVYAPSSRGELVLQNKGVSIGGYNASAPAISNAKTLQVVQDEWGGGTAAIRGQVGLTPSTLFLGTSAGVWGDNGLTPNGGPGVFGSSQSENGVVGMTVDGYAGVVGRLDNALAGLSTGEQAGVLGIAIQTSQLGVVGASSSYIGVRGQGPTGIHGVTYTYNGTALMGSGQGGGTSEWGVYGSSSSGYAGYFSGKVHVTGNLTAGGTKPFIQPHAKDPSKEIVYIAAEAPEAVVLYRGTEKLRNGRAVVVLPEHFSIVAGDEGIQVQVTPVEDCKGIFVKRKNKNSFEVREVMGGRHNARFDYLVTAKRSGYEGHQAVQANTHFLPLKESVAAFEQRYAGDDMSMQATRNMLIANGILTSDGRLNRETARKLGWKTEGPEFVVNRE